VSEQRNIVKGTPSPNLSTYLIFRSCHICRRTVWR